MILRSDEAGQRGMGMADYRLYFFDAKNHIKRRIDLECRDDAHAIEVSGEHASQGVVELWRRDRLVKRFEPPRR